MERLYDLRTWVVFDFQIPVKSTPQMAYIMEQFRQNQVTSHKVCRGHNQMEHLADTYKCLLESVRKNQVCIFTIFISP